MTLKRGLWVGALLLALPCGARHEPDVAQALQILLAGNERYVAQRAEHPDQSTQRRLDVAEDQHPFAVVLGCADSRVPPELVFDQGLGDLFVVRVAGNTLDDEILGSIEYAVEHLGVRLVVVLGHENCGAVKAALQGGSAAGHISSVLAPIQRGVKAVSEKGGDPVNNAVRANVLHVVKQLRSSKPVLTEFVRDGRVHVVGAEYHLHSGKVELLSHEPAPRHGRAAPVND
jgi:carbonic anhydrase